MSEKQQSLAEYLGLDAAPAVQPSDAAPHLDIDIADAKEFGKAVLNSREFRQYILTGLTLGDLPGFATILKFFLEHACGKSPDKLELTGKDGAPIETVAVVRRVIVRADPPEYFEESRPEPKSVH